MSWRGKRKMAAVPFAWFDGAPVLSLIVTPPLLNAEAFRALAFMVPVICPEHERHGFWFRLNVPFFTHPVSDHAG